MKNVFFRVIPKTYQPTCYLDSFMIGLYIFFNESHVNAFHTINRLKNVVLCSPNNKYM